MISFIMYIVLLKFGVFIIVVNGKLYVGVKCFIIFFYVFILNKWKIDVLYMCKFFCRLIFFYLGIFI